MFNIYLQELFPGQPHVSCNLFLDLPLFKASAICYDGLDTRLIMHQLDTGCVSHLDCPRQHSLFASIEILDIGKMSLFHECQMNVMY